MNPDEIDIDSFFKESQVPIVRKQWTRTCQECGNQQKDKRPMSDPTNAYRNRKCKKCKSEALDYGSWKSIL